MKRVVTNDVSFQVIQNSEGEKMAPWTCHRIEAIKDQKIVGYIKLCYITAEDFNEYFPNALWYLARQAGWCNLLPALISRDKIAITKALHSYCRFSNDYETLVKHCLKTHDKAFKQFRDFWVEKPIVEYSKVEEACRRQGIGTTMYLFAIQWLRDQNLTLYLSSLQSEAAQELWKKLAELVDLKAEVEYFGKNQQRNRYYVA